MVMRIFPVAILRDGGGGGGSDSSSRTSQMHDLTGREMAVCQATLAKFLPRVRRTPPYEQDVTKNTMYSCDRANQAHRKGGGGAHARRRGQLRWLGCIGPPQGATPLAG